ncbi:MAG TPA: VOC family protein [Candidatus Saccharimonadales bacterium]|nr:VOC family protein [Candidatus Saccharimonadales bacterium]
MQKITPNLWFDNEAEEAANFYVEVFNANPAKEGTSKVGNIVRYSADTPSNKPKGSVMTVDFELEGQQFLGLNGGSFFKLNEAVSFIIDCETQEEIDYFWGKLSAVPESEQCGWLKDKFGLSWQVAPSKFLTDLLGNLEGDKAEKVMKVFLEMKKIDIAELEKAAE